MGAKQSSTPSVKNVTDKITKFQLELSLLESRMQPVPLFQAANNNWNSPNMYAKIRKDVNDFGNECISSMWTGNWNQDHINTHIQILTRHLTTLESIDVRSNDSAKSRERCVVLLSDIMLPIGTR